MKRQFLRHTGRVHVPKPTRRARLVTVATFLLVALAASACGGGARPTLTAERIPENEDTDIAPAEVEPPTPNPELEDFVADVTDQDAEILRQAAPPAVPGEVQQLTVEILETFPHDSEAFTQGLELQNGLLPVSYTHLTLPTTPYV